MLTAAAHTPPVSRRVPQLVLSVVLSRVFAHARPTASPTQPSGAVAIGKLFERLCLPAASAESHPDFLGKISASISVARTLVLAPSSRRQPSCNAVRLR